MQTGFGDGVSQGFVHFRFGSDLDGAVIILFDVIRTGFRSQFKEGIEVHGAFLEQEISLAGELPGNGAAFTQVSACAGKRVTDFSNGAVAVFGNTFDHQRDALGPVAFIHDLFKNCTVFGFTGTALDRTIDAVFRHVVGTCLINGQT